MIHPLALNLALALTVGLFVVGGQPAAGQVFAGSAHFVAHLLAYGVIALAYAHGFSRWPVWAVALLVTAIGAAHELYEISAHSHPFEFLDAGVNGAGAVAGALAERGWRRWGRSLR